MNSHMNWHDARQHYYHWLTTSSQDERRDTFLALGPVIHLIQDAAQPQHTRPESHNGSRYEACCDRFKTEATVQALGSASIPSLLVRKRTMGTASDVFNELSIFLCKYCDKPDVIIQVDMDFTVEPFMLKVIRHVRDPSNIFDTASDVPLPLPAQESTFVRSKAEEYYALTQEWEDEQLNTTVSVYQDGTWSVGGSSKKR